MKCGKVCLPVCLIAPVRHASGRNRCAAEYHFPACIVDQCEFIQALGRGPGDQRDLWRCDFVADLIYQDTNLSGSQRYRQRAGSENKKVSEGPNRFVLLEAGCDYTAE
jgi:hypothetical protein